MNECQLCHSELTAEQQRLGNLYCGSSCAAKVNNRNRGTKLFCHNCHQELDRSKSQKKFCSHSCQHAYYLDLKIKSGNATERTFRKYLLKTRELRCSVCQRVRWCRKPIPLEMDHIDGNSSNNDLSNLRLVCPNCHAQTPTWKNRTSGTGRAKRRQRYRDGKSY